MLSPAVVKKAKVSEVKGQELPLPPLDGSVVDVTDFGVMQKEDLSLSSYFNKLRREEEVPKAAVC